MKLSISFRAPAKSEYEAAVAWYNEARAGLGSEFEDLAPHDVLAGFSEACARSGPFPARRRGRGRLHGPGVMPSAV